MTSFRLLATWQIAWPIIVSNLSTPLLGLVDTAVIGNLGDPALIGAIAVGGMIFSFLYWGFGFLRMGTTGLVAQALGGDDEAEASLSLQRAFLLGVAIGGMLLVLQVPLLSLALTLIDGSDAVEAAATTYFTIRIWGAPVSLAYLAVLGFMLGSQDARSILVLQLVLNLTNIVLDFVFVIGFGLDVAGVALATVIAEVVALSVGLALLARHPRYRHRTGGTLLATEPLKRMFAVNRDIMIRPLCLIFAFAWFTNQGASQGDITLAANAILMQLVSFSAFFLDGYALAAESLVGNAVGRKRPGELRDAMISASLLALGNALVLSLTFALIGTLVIDVLTNATDVRTEARVYLAWAIAAPMVSVACYLLDGIFIGATRTPEMRNAMIGSLAIYLVAWYLAVPAFGNHGLWLALMIYFAARAGTLAFYLPRVLRSATP